MTNVVILCIEDEPEVRDAVIRDLEPFAETFLIEAAEDVEDAREVIEECFEAGRQIGLVLCDHLLPGTPGVDYLVELNGDPRTVAARKVLVTGQAGLEDTVRAVNQAGLHHYIAKPWSLDDFRQVVRDQLTEYVIEQEEDLLPFVHLLDGPRLLEEMRSRKEDP